MNKKCNRCKNDIVGHPAISRVDNLTEICSDCGTVEAIEEYLKLASNGEIRYRTILVRKAIDLNELIIRTKNKIEEANIFPKLIRLAKTIEITKEEFDELKDNLLKDNRVIKENKHLCVENKYLLIKEQDTIDEKGIIVDPQGFDYARYSGVIVSKIL